MRLLKRDPHGPAADVFFKDLNCYEFYGIDRLSWEKVLKDSTVRLLHGMGEII
jgi:hypothetical protein